MAGSTEICTPFTQKAPSVISTWAGMGITWNSWGTGLAQAITASAESRMVSFFIMYG